MQHTMLTLFAMLAHVSSVPLADTTLLRLGSEIHTLEVRGTLQATGTQTLSGIPFDAIVDEDTMRMTTSGPFGITAARLYAQPDSFVMVNYLMREVYVGHPDSPSLLSVLPVPISVTDMRMLIRGKLHGDLGRFTRGETRADESVLFVAKSSSHVEFALVDTLLGVLKQYQRKNADGKISIDVMFRDVRLIDEVYVPHAIDVQYDDKRQSVGFRFASVNANRLLREKLTVSVPPSFTRTTFH